MDKLIIALNKIDLITGELQPVIKSLRAKFKHTKFGPFLPIVPVAAAPKTDEKENEQQQESRGVEDLIKTILQ